MNFDTQHPLLIVGGGNMGTALAMRWRDYSPVIVESSPLRRAALKDEGFTTHESLNEVNTKPRAIVLAIKPQSYPEMKGRLQRVVGEALLISIMAGVPLSAFPARAVRVMPNTPAMVGQGMSVCCGSTLSPDDKQMTQDLFAACGEVSWVDDESLMHAITAISGSGPAYVFAFMEALEKAACQLGIEPAIAHTIVKQTMLGSVSMGSTPFADFALLREQVTSKGGTTEAAMEAMLPALFELVETATKAAATRSKQLSE